MTDCGSFYEVRSRLAVATAFLIPFVVDQHRSPRELEFRRNAHRLAAALAE